MKKKSRRKGKDLAIRRIATSKLSIDNFDPFTPKEENIKRGSAAGSSTLKPTNSLNPAQRKKASETTFLKILMG